MHKVRELHIWKKAMNLVSDVYNMCADLPNDEKYGLISQIKRAAVSIPTNIAEGAGRNSNKEFIHFLSIANGSSYELETQLLLLTELKFLKDKDINNILNQLVEIQKMNYSFQKSLTSQN
ncbi:MAG: four helix bundle protein [Flavobacteriaceae bacterium]|nr:four helix bundle protein [Flavobacteriaceae bacterium]|tara:strand:+ start:52602 stop:52961 length:360 start_codon:yes stop_codon:yes gene_type:complete